MLDNILKKDKKKDKTENKNSKTLLYSATATMGVIGTVVWQKRDLLKAVALLTNPKTKWVQIDAEPETYMTANKSEDQEELFDYFRLHGWRFADQIADGHFWLNDNDEIILLHQKKVLHDKYSLWIASKSFGIKTE